MKIGIFGIGAIGHVISHSLWQHEGDLIFFNRSKKDVFRFKIEKVIVEKPIDVFTTPKPINSLDWLVICLKEYHFEKAIPWLQKLVSAKTKMVVIRNGLDLKGPLLPYFNPSQILETIIDAPTQMNSDGFYEVLRSPKLLLPDNLLAAEFQNLINQDFLSVQLVDDFKTKQWQKLIESASLGALLALSGETCWILEDEKVMALYGQLIEEAIQVAQKDGALIYTSFKMQLIEKAKKYPPEKGSSMLTDKLNGRPIEINAKSGVISRLGKAYGIATPLHDFASVLLGKTNTSK